MKETAEAINNLGISAVIAAIFIWDWIANRQAIKDSISMLEKSNIMLERSLSNQEQSLDELKQSNINVGKSLEILQRTIDQQGNKLEICKIELSEIKTKLNESR